MNTINRLPLLACILTALAGCGTDNGRDNHGYGYHYDRMGETGLRIRYEAGRTTPTLMEIETIFREVETCVGATATGPLVIFLNFTTAGIQYSETLLGQTYLDTGTVMINTAYNGTQVYWALKHEFIHYLLGQTGFPYEANMKHDSPLFLDCGYPKLEPAQQ